MSRRFKFLEDVALADIAFEAYGKTVEELFQNAALALEEVMVKTITVEPLRCVKCQVSSVKLEDLLFSLLEELVFLKDSKQLVFSKFKIKIKLDDRRYTLNANLYGEKIDLKKHKLRTDVKALTYHLFSLQKMPNFYKARAVLDV